MCVYCRYVYKRFVTHQVEEPRLLQPQVIDVSDPDGRVVRCRAQLHVLEHEVRVLGGQGAVEGEVEAIGQHDKLPGDS